MPYLYRTEVAPLHRSFPSLLLAGVVILLPLVGGAQAASPAVNLWSPQIGIVFPTNGAGRPTNVAASTEANVSIWPLNQVRCGQAPNPAEDLFVAKNTDPVEPVTVAPRIVQRTVGGVSFPTEEYDNVPADLAVDPTAKYTFVTYQDGSPTSNIWVHAADPRTYYPHPVVPTGYVQGTPAALDTRIQVVFPHDERGNFAPPRTATRVNIAVDIFAHGTLLSLPTTADYNVYLWWAQNNDPAYLAPGVGLKTTYTSDGHVYPRWVFNDFPVNPGGVYHFYAITGALGQPGASYPSIWTHAADARTLLPSPHLPPTCAP